MKTYVRTLTLGMTFLAFVGCKKAEEPMPAAEPVQEQMSAPMETPVEPGMEPQNPAETEGKTQGQ
jgi:hypothetical protein